MIIFHSPLLTAKAGLWSSQTAILFFSGPALDGAGTKCWLPADGCYLQITVHSTWKPKNAFVPHAVVIRWFERGRLFRYTARLLCLALLPEKKKKRKHVLRKVTLERYCVKNVGHCFLWGGFLRFRNEALHVTHLERSGSAFVCVPDGNWSCTYSRHEGVCGCGGIAPVILYRSARWSWVFGFMPLSPYP